MADETQAMTVRFPPETYERLRKAAFDRREPMNTIVVRATESELDVLTPPASPAWGAPDEYVRPPTDPATPKDGS
jgi:hypothetical protein